MCYRMCTIEKNCSCERQGCAEDKYKISVQSHCKAMTSPYDACIVTLVTYKSWILYLIAAHPLGTSIIRGCPLVLSTTIRSYSKRFGEYPGLGYAIRR